MPPSAVNGAVPVEALLKLTLDKAGASSIEDFLGKQEASFGNVAKYVDRIAGGVESIGRLGMGLAGVYGFGQIAGQFLGTSSAGSGVALAAGHATGGAGVWHPYQQGLLAAQAHTGVAANAIAQGLMTALQQTGGSPSPQMAQVLGGLIAGFGQTVGLTPSQVSQMVGPLLQASNKPLTPGNALGVMNTVSGGLYNLPGSQQSAMLGLISQLGFAQAVGSGPQHGYTTDIKGLVSTVNAAVGQHSIWHNPSLTGGAINAISGGLQNAYGNPALESFMNMAGISYADQRRGFTASNMQKIMGEATRMYGTGNTRDVFLRSVFGLQGADLLEQFSPGSRGAQALQHNLHFNPSIGALQRRIGHAQAGTTPESELQKLAGGALGWLFGSPLHAAVGGAGIIGAGMLAKKALPRVGTGLGALAAGLGPELLGVLGLAGGEGLLFGVGTDMLPKTSAHQQGVVGAEWALNQAMHQFGSISSPQAKKWLWQQFAHRKVGQGKQDAITSLWNEATNLGTMPAGAGIAQQLLQKVWHSLSGADDPLTQFKKASQLLYDAANLLKNGGRPSGPHGVSYQLGTAAIQGIGQSAPGMEFAALALGASSGGSGGVMASMNLASGGGGGSAGGAGWSNCTMTWYDPALGGTNSRNGAANPHSPMANGQPYQARGHTCAAPSQYAFGTQIQFAYQGRSVTCTVTDRGGAITGSHFDLSRGAASALGIIQAGVAHGQFRTLGAGSSARSPSSSSASGGHASGGQTGGGANNPAAAGGSVLPAFRSGHASQPVHVHVYVDGHEIRRRRILTGHRA